VLGIAVDDTIHFLSRFNTEAKRRASEKEGLVFAMRTVGVPVTSTSIALCLGFLVMTTAQRSAQVEFGALAAATLAVAWLADVTFTPALAARMRIVTLWEMLTLDLGEDPNETIPFFHGLSRTQARAVALLTNLRTYPAGHRLFSIGDEGDSLVVVIDGRLEVTISGDEGPIRLQEQKRGDVIGEVALFEGKRTAQVEALTDVRLLELSNDDLARVKRRYPRVGAQLYRNLSEILAARLTRLTQQVR
jgi:CRP-like cAMP-binding protein